MGWMNTNISQFWQNWIEKEKALKKAAWNYYRMQNLFYTAIQNKLGLISANVLIREPEI